MEVPAIFNQTSYDSGALSGMSSVAHKFDQPGVFAATVHRDGSPVATVQLAVAIPHPSAQTAAAPPPEPAAMAGTLNALAGMMPHVDLAQLPAIGQQAILHTAAEGYALFHAMSGESGFAVTVHPAAEPTAGAPQAASGAPLFDSRELGPGDVFSTLVLRPGAYSVKNAVGGAESTLTVAYPAIGRYPSPYVAPAPAEVDCSDAGFSPESVNLLPAQGLIFRINTRARITIELVTPDDGPGSGQPRTGQTRS